jgi:hypothetical protein
MIKLTSYITNTGYTRFAFRFWRIGFGVFKPGGKEGWIAFYTKQGPGSTPAASFYKGRVYFRIGRLTLVWCIKGLPPYWSYCWPRNKWL